MGFFPKLKLNYCISSNNFAPKGGNYSREDNYSREAIISNISHRRSCHKYFVLLYHEIKKLHNHIKNKPNMGFLRVSNFVLLINQCPMSISSASEPELSLITFTGSDCSCEQLNESLFVTQDFNF